MSQGSQASQRNGDESDAEAQAAPRPPNISDFPEPAAQPPWRTLPAQASTGASMEASMEASTPGQNHRLDEARHEAPVDGQDDERESMTRRAMRRAWKNATADVPREGSPLSDAERARILDRLARAFKSAQAALDLWPRDDTRP
jgi:hypothetical protein